MRRQRLNERQQLIGEKASGSEIGRSVGMADFTAGGVDDGIGGVGSGRVSSGGQKSIHCAFSSATSPPNVAMDAQKQLQALSDEFQQLQTGMLALVVSFSITLHDF